MQGRIEAFYDQDASSYQERRWFGDLVAQSNYWMTRAALLETLMPTAGERILEFGCGPGTWTRLVAGMGAVVTAVDLSAEMLARAREYTQNDAITFIKADFCGFQSAEPFDKVFGVRAFEHFPDKRLALQTAHTLLRPDGRLVVITKTVPSIWNGRVRVRRTVRRLLRRAERQTNGRETFWMARVTPWRLTALFREAGFAKVQVFPGLLRLPVMVRGEEEYPIVPPRFEDQVLRFSEVLAGSVRRGNGLLRWGSLFFSESYLVTGSKPGDERG